MGLSTDIRNMFINLTGYFIYKKKDLPVGVDLKLDLDYKFGIATRCIFDVGANYGQTALHFLYEFPEATIYSFEPVRASFQVLVENTMKESKIKSFCLAFGERKQEIEISLFDEKQSQLNSLKESNSNPVGKKERIQVTTIDSFTSENKITSIDLLKIDTEGYEIEVLRGAIGMLETGNIKAILCEVALSGRNKRNTALSELMELLDHCDYFFTGLYDTNINDYKSGLAYSNALFIRKST